MSSMSSAQPTRFVRSPTATSAAIDDQLDRPGNVASLHDAERATAARSAGVAAPGLLQRILLTTDGNVGRILENYAGEGIVAVRLDQSTSPGGEPSRALELGADDERLTRRALLRTSASGRTLIYAETLVAIARVHPLVRSGLLATSEPIGRLLVAARLETFRDILSAGTERAGAIAAHFGIDRDDTVFTRTYRIIAGGRPVMLITEKFPTTWFL